VDWNIEFTTTAIKQLQKLDKKWQSLILAVIISHWKNVYRE